MNWPHILAQKAFWLYYLRLFQAFDGDYVAACCDFFGVAKNALEDTILQGLYQIHLADEEEPIVHVLGLPATTGARLEIEFRGYGPGEQFRLVDGSASLLVADVDIDDVCVPCFPLRLLPLAASRLSGELAHTYGALLLYKLTYAAPEDDLEALTNILRAAFSPGLFTAAEQEHILTSQRRAWRNQQRRPRPVRCIEHPAWQRLVGDNTDA